MFLMDDTQRALWMTFMITSMLSIGLQTSIDGLRQLAANHSFVLRALLLNLVAVPLAGVAVARVLPVAPPVAMALMMLACAPGGISALQFTTKIKGEAALAGALAASLSLSAIVLSPFLFQWLAPEGVEIRVPYGTLLGFFGLFLLAPLALGMAVLTAAPALAPKLAKIIGLIAAVSFVAFALSSSAFRKEATASLGAEGVGALLALIGLSMLAGWLVGGPARETRQALATATSMRNAIVCIAVLHASAPEHPAIIPLVAFSMLMVFPNMALTLFWAVRSRRQRAKSPGQE